MHEFSLLFYERYNYLIIYFYLCEIHDKLMRVSEAGALSLMSLSTILYWLDRGCAICWMWRGSGRTASFVRQGSDDSKPSTQCCSVHWVRSCDTIVTKTFVFFEILSWKQLITQYGFCNIFIKFRAIGFC